MGHRGYLWSRPAGMDLQLVHTLFGALAGDRTTILYSGRFHDDLSPALIAMGREVRHQDDERAIGGRLSFVLVEAFQNIIRHGVGSDAGRPLLMLRSRGGAHEVVAMNTMAEGGLADLEQRLARLRGLDRAQLKDLFLRSLARTERTERGGAGLGLIEMARRSGHGLRHRLSPMDGGRAHFTLQVQVGGEAVGFSNEAQLDILYRIVTVEGLLLLCMGRIAPGMQDAMRPLLGLDLDPGRRGGVDLGRAFLAGMSFLQVQDDARPMFAVFRRPEGIGVVLALHLDNAAADALQALVHELEGLSPTEKQRRYRDLLLGRSPDEHGGLTGLLELARLGHVPISMERSHEDGLVVLRVMV